MESKIRIKIGQTEVEYEGSETFIKEELVNFVKTIMEFSSKAIMLSGAEVKQTESVGGILKMSTGTIAAKLSCNTGTDLLLAAATNLTLVQNRETFSRQQLLNEMQNATGYYKTTYAKNLSSYLRTLIRTGKINESTSGQYALTADTRKEMQTRLAN